MGALVDAKGKGTISINIKGSGKQIHDVLYVSDLEENLLSVGQLMENGFLLCLEIIIAGFMIKLSQIKSLFKLMVFFMCAKIAWLSCQCRIGP